MPKVSKTKLCSVASKFKNDSIVSDGSIIKCCLCDSVIKIDERHQSDRITQHISGARHKEMAAKLKSTTAKQSFIAESFDKAEKRSNHCKKFEMDLTCSFIQAGIPLFKLNLAPLKKFFEEYTQSHIPDESTLRKNYVKPVYDETIAKVREVIGESPICFILDETTDTMQRFVLNILVVPLNGQPIKPMLIKMYVLEKTNNSTIMQSFIDACSFVWMGPIQYDKVLLAVSDQASYILLAMSNLKAMFPNLNHVTCLAHSLHRICEVVRDEYSAANDFIATVHKVLLKAPARIQLYKEITGLPLPPDAVVTCWGTWINCATFYCQNFEKIKAFLDSLPADSKACEKAKSLVNKDDVKDELFNSATYYFLVGTIEKLEKSNVNKEDQWKLFQDAGEALTGFGREKFTFSLAKNPDVATFATDKNPEFRLKTLYAPLVSVDVERSFSQYKLILSDRRQNFTFENIE